MFALCVLAVFCSVTLSRSAPPACEGLVRPLDPLDRDHLAGRWVMVAGVLSDPAHLEHFKTRDSAVITFANSSDSSKLSFTCAFNFGGNCRYLHCNISLVGSSFTLNDVNVTVTFLSTSCPDCLAMHFNNRASKVQRLYLFSRRREVEPRVMEELQDQSRCLHLTPLVVMDPTKELCLKEMSGQRDTGTQTVS
ncbi:unnamed protein product [Pleuronectes platessa]|uniref:Apolipoprotein M n=1 Tax=Pleuronectes platessa TaxID=8262 RepID=A0A9N7UPU6_PLEPL|nr:unnamed protein product [Pleuronectes platessa]